MSSRNEVFQQLKVPCIGLSQTALLLAGNKGKPADVSASLRQLKTVLENVQRTRGDIDAKIADYVFFPLSHVLKASQTLPGSALELALACLTILLRTGWQANIGGDLALQLLILLSYLASTSDLENKPLLKSEELQAQALECLSALFDSLRQATQANDLVSAAENVPVYGHAMSTILEGVGKGPSSAVQLAASRALGSAISAAQDVNALANFLPGVISTLTRALTPAAGLKRNHIVLSVGLDNMKNILVRVLSDSVTSNLPVLDDTQRKHESSLVIQMTQSWVKATAGQIRQSLMSISRLRYHEREDVRRGLLSLCTMIIEDCQNALSNCNDISMDILIQLSQTDIHDDAFASLQQALISRPGLSEALKDDLYAWVISLPRVVTSKDDEAQKTLLGKLSIALQVLRDIGANLHKIEISLTTNLCDSITAIMKSDRDVKTPAVSDIDLALSEVQIATNTPREPPFGPVITHGPGGSQTISHIRTFLQTLSTSREGRMLATGAMAATRRSTGEAKVASTWLCKTMLEIIGSHDSIFHDFIDVEEDLVNEPVILASEIYAMALSTLSDDADESPAASPWRLSALALETVAAAAQTQKLGFRPELMDVLYPMLHLMGSSYAELRSHAITALNIVANACEYSAVSDMIVDNVDYLVNAVALKLNAFELSPQAPQVLLMMVRLTGPALVPYLDDLVVSIFAALESYHGYPKLVELLFSTLRAITEEGAKTPSLVITIRGEQPQPDRGKPHSISNTIEDIRGLQQHVLSSREEEKAEPFSEQAWSHEKAAEADDDNEPTPHDEDVKPPAPKTYSLLLRISKLTQHYLSSTSPALRVSLLLLLSTTLPALAAHENSFLPLINTLWPVLTPRLDDNEGFVVADTLDIVALMCVHGGNFMRGRVNEIWPTLRKLHRRYGKNTENLINTLTGETILGKLDITKSAADGTATMYQNYVEYSSRLILRSLIELQKAIMSHVDLDDQKFDEVLEFLEPSLPSRPDVRQALGARNQDALWLRLVQAGIERPLMRSPPVLNSWVFPTLRVVC